MSRLFREEVIEAKRGEWLGTIRLATPLSHRILTLFALAVAAALIAFLVFGQYTRRERATGMLVPTAGLIEITASTTATVTQTMVDQGAIVHAGDPLVALSSERISIALGDTGAVVSAQLKLQRARIDADLGDQTKLEQERAIGINNRIALLRAQLAQLDGQLAIQHQQALSARAMLDKIQPLQNKGYISALQLQQQESAALAAEAQVKALGRQRLDSEQQLSMLQDQLRQLPLTAQAQRRDLERKRAEIDQSVAENEAQRATVLRAPQDGTVSSVLVKPGQTVAPGQSVLALVPKDSSLQAQLLVPSRAIGFVKAGNAVVLRYQAFPYQKFGLHRGHIENVSHNAMTPAQVGNLFGQQTNEAMYRVDVELDTQSVEAYGKLEALKPGMALDADILLDRRHLIEWVFEPLYGMGKQVTGTD
jgi:membrane fusion protein